MNHADDLRREKARAKLVAGWFGLNPGCLEAWTIDGDRVVALFRLPLTPEELEEYGRLVAGEGGPSIGEGSTGRLV